MQTARIDKAFTPKATDNLVRLGDDFDGGYVVDRKAVEQADILIALGVGDSWAFEADCLALNPVPLEAYDGTVGPGWYWGEFAKSLVVFFNYKFVRRRWKILSGYFRFFSGDRRHHRVMVGRDLPPGETTFDKVIEAHGIGAGKKVFLKIDIEGSEYHLLDTLIANAKHITGLAIEFHDFDRHLAEIKTFAKAFGLNIAHVHCNNCAPIAADGTPEVIEISFTQSAPDSKKPPALPGPLDMPNEKTRDDYAISFV